MGNQDDRLSARTRLHGQTLEPSENSGVRGPDAVEAARFGPYHARVTGARRSARGRRVRLRLVRFAARGGGKQFPLPRLVAYRPNALP